MSSRARSPKAGSPHRIAVNLRNVGQLFNTMDPSPFHEKDLDGDAEEFIESRARELPAGEPIALVVHLADCSDGPATQVMIEAAVRHHFAERGRLNQLEFRRLMQEGRRCLVIGLAFLGSCLLLSETLAREGGGTAVNVVRESLTIGGWVAMWRPMEIYLYDWWPLRQLGRIYQKLSHISVEVRLTGHDGH